MVSLNALSSIRGITLSRVAHDVSRHGLVLISISQGLKSSSIIKSKPKTSKVGSPSQPPRSCQVASIESLHILLSCGVISSRKFLFFPRLSRYF